MKTGYLGSYEFCFGFFASAAARSTALRLRDIVFVQLKIDAIDGNFGQRCSSFPGCSWERCYYRRLGRKPFDWTRRDVTSRSSSRGLYN